MIPFNKPARVGTEADHVAAAMRSGRLSGGGDYTRRCQEWFEKNLDCSRALMTPSCTHGLEMTAILAEVAPGDEVIMPSYTFVSTANAFVLRGATIVFVDIRPDTLNMDERLVEYAVTSRTRAIVPVHYAGVACDMDPIMEVAERHGLAVIEDAAQAMLARYKGRLLGTLGHMSAFSFHETKNFTSGGEGGMLVANDPRFSTRAEVIQEKGTNRKQFFRGAVDKYSWVDVGSSYLPSELQAAYLWGQLERSEEINADRLRSWATYEAAFQSLAARGALELPSIPSDCVHNGHIFHLRVEDLAERTALLEHLAARDVHAVFHYVPLHSATAGRVHGRFHGEDRHTTVESERLLRLPLWYGMSSKELDRVVEAVLDFFDG